MLHNFRTLSYHCVTFTYYLSHLKLKSLFFQKGLALFFVAIAVFYEIYKICIPLHLSDLNFSSNFRHEFSQSFILFQKNREFAET